MKIVDRRLEEIRPYEKNPRRNEAAVEYVAESIKTFGWKQPIVVDKDGVIIAGHTRYKAAQMLGLEKVPCLIADDLTEEEVRAYRIADNKVADFSVWDNKLLLEELESLRDELFTGFEWSELFDDSIDEADNSVLQKNTAGVVYEIVFKSEDAERIERIRGIWETMGDE